VRDLTVLDNIFERVPAPHVIADCAAALIRRQRPLRTKNSWTCSRMRSLACSTPCSGLSTSWTITSRRRCSGFPCNYSMSGRAEADSKVERPGVDLCTPPRIFWKVSSVTSTKEGRRHLSRTGTT